MDEHVLDEAATVGQASEIEGGADHIKVKDHADETSIEDIEAVEETVIKITLNGQMPEEGLGDSETISKPEAADGTVDPVAAIEAVIFASGSPIDEEKIGAITGFSDNDIAESLLTIRKRYQEIDGGIELVQLGDKFQFRTKPQFAEMLQRLKEEKPKRLSTAALETLAIVAYRQPIIKSDVEGIRGVDATPTIKTLLDRNLIKIVGHQQTVGSPALYATTDEFLKLFSLGSLAELPTLRDLAPLEEDPGEIEVEEESSHTATENPMNLP